jgi:hypothetical protein
MDVYSVKISKVIETYGVWIPSDERTDEDKALLKKMHDFYYFMWDEDQFDEFCDEECFDDHEFRQNFYDYMMEEDNDDPAVEKQLLRLLNFV